MSLIANNNTFAACFSVTMINCNLKLEISRYIILVVSVEHAIRRTYSVDTHLYYSKSNSSYMFRLHKPTIVRLYVSENVNRTLFRCTNYYSRIILCLHFLIHTAWRWQLCAAETCSCYLNCCNKCVLMEASILLEMEKLRKRTFVALPIEVIGNSLI